MQRADKNYKDLKQKQKSVIADKTYSMYSDFSLLQVTHSGGTPYGVTWEEMGLKPWEDLKKMSKQISVKKSGTVSKKQQDVTLMSMRLD